MRFWILFGVFFALIESSLGQSLTVLVKDQDKKPLIGATLQLLRNVDSLAFYAVTDPDGKASFQKLAPGGYTMLVSYIGYRTAERPLQVGSGSNRQEIVLEEETVALEEVTVVAKRPLVRQEDDKMIIDPEPIANTSTNTLEILEKTPGLFVDQDGYIYLNSATPAVVFINGREQRMSAQDIAGILRSLPPDNIQKIEVLRTPSTKFDAASSGGIVNVVLKKGVRIGRTGSLNAGMNQGVYGNRFAGFNINDSNDKSTYYLRVNASQRDLVEDISSSRLISADSDLNQIARSRQPGDQGFVGFGISYDPNAKWNLNYDGRINGSRSKASTRNFNFLESAENGRLTENDNLIDNDSWFGSLQQDLGAQYKIDTLGSEWDTKFSYTYSSSNNEQDYQSLFLLPLNRAILGGGENLQNRHFALFQSDLTYQLPKKIKVETGIKSTYQYYRSSADYFFRINGGQTPDPLRTNAFTFQENIHAAYAQASKTFPGNFTVKSGVRMEYTNMKGNQTIPADTSFLINRADLFPYLYISRRVAEIAKYELRGYLIYRRTINRPGYQSLNPYVRIVDQFLSETGNPGLQPQFTDNFEANVSFDDQPILAIGRNYTRNIFSQVVYEDPNNENAVVRTFDNVGTNKETYFRVIGALPPGGKYFFVVGAQYNLNEYDGLYEGQPLSFTRGSWRFFTFHQLSLSKDTKFTLSGFMLLRGQQGFYELDTFGQLNLGLNQSFLDKKLNVTLNANDVLRTMVTRFTLNQGSVSTFGERYSDNQRIGLNVRYQFGIRKKEEQRSPLQFDAE